MGRNNNPDIQPPRSGSGIVTIPPTVYTPPQSHIEHHGPTFVDAPGVFSITEMFNGYIVRYTAPTLDDLLALQVRYQEANKK